MTEILACLFCTAGCFFISRHIAGRNFDEIHIDSIHGTPASWLIAFSWMGWSCFLMNRQSIQGLSEWIFLSIALFLPYCQDLMTFTFDWKFWWIWLTVFGLFFLVANPIALPSRLSGLLPAVLMIPFVLSRTMGSADFIFMLVFGFLLGFERAAVCLILGILLGLVYAAVMALAEKKSFLIPFVSALSLAFLISFYRGYSIWFFLLKLFTFC